MLRVFTNDYDTVIAHDLGDIRHVYLEFIGEDYFVFASEMLGDFREVPPEAEIAIRFERDQYDGTWADRQVKKGEHGEMIVTKTAAEWIKSEGRCFLCSTEW
jgi:hypothetical protein